MGDGAAAASRASALRTTAGSVVVHIGARLARQEAAVARGGQPRVEHRDHAAVGGRPDQPAGALREQQRGVGGGDLHEPVAAGPVGGALPGAHQRVVGAGERDPVDEHQLAGVAGHVEPLPQREGAEQRGVRVVDELPGQLGQLGVALGQRGQVRQPLADGLRGGLGGPPAREQPERPALAGVDQLDDLVELRHTEAVAARRRQVAGDVEDRLLGVVERAADVEAAPGQHAVVALDTVLIGGGRSRRSRSA